MTIHVLFVVFVWLKSWPALSAATPQRSRCTLFRWQFVFGLLLFPLVLRSLAHVGLFMRLRLSMAAVLSEAQAELSGYRLGVIVPSCGGPASLLRRRSAHGPCQSSAFAIGCAVVLATHVGGVAQPSPLVLLCCCMWPEWRSRLIMGRSRAGPWPNNQRHLTFLGGLPLRLGRSCIVWAGRRGSFAPYGSWSFQAPAWPMSAMIPRRRRTNFLVALTRHLRFPNFL